MTIIAGVFAILATGPPPQAVLALAAGETMVIFTFEKPSDADAWLVTNDGVMGGLSKGRRVVTGEDVLRFTGEVSLDNNGGFSAIRSAPVERDLSAYDGILIRVRGDGKRYSLTLRTDVDIRAGSYRVKFDTKADEWVELYVPFTEFRATSFGTELPDAPPLDPGKIRSFGFIVSDKQAGRFTLDVAWIKATSRSQS